MYQRIKASLMNPKKIVDYLNDKFYITVIYVIVFALLFSLPYLLIMKDFGSSVKSTMAKSLKNADEIEYVIENGKLVSLIEENKTHIIKFDKTSLNNFTLVIGDNLDSIEKDITNPTLIIQYANDGIYFCQSALLTAKTKLIDYTDSFVDLRLINDGNLDSINGMLKYVDLFIDQYKVIIYSIGIPTVLVYSAMEILFTTLMSTVLLLIFFGRNGIKFGQIFKVTLYCSLPTVVGLLLTMLFSSWPIAGIFNHIGFCATTCFAIIAINELNKRNILKKNEGNENESI